MIDTLKPMDNQIVLMGMSCVGKTHFAYRFKGDYKIHHFDAEYKYNLNLPGVSKLRNCLNIIGECGDKFILDNWTTEDKVGALLYEKKPNACIYVIYDTYRNILDRYRVPIVGEDAHYTMYKKMYTEIPFEKYKNTRFFKVEKHGFSQKKCDNLDKNAYYYYENTVNDFRQFINDNLSPDHGRKFNPQNRTWIY